MFTEKAKSSNKNMLVKKPKKFFPYCRVTRRYYYTKIG